jgi:hypothetical protein
MFQLDFALLNMRNQDRSGLAFPSLFRDRLAPLFFRPRVDKLVDFTPLGYKGCSLLLPLGPGNWNTLSPGLKQIILQKSYPLLKNYQINALAAEHGMQNQLLQLSTTFPLIFGDNFIKVLLLNLTRAVISRIACKRLVLVGEMTDMPEFMPMLKQLAIPVSIQTYFPGRLEVAAYHMLYERGIAVSTSYVNPRGWESGDLVVIIDSAYKRYIPLAARTLLLNLTEDSVGLAPELERCLEQRGLPAGLKVMAPILESCLGRQAGFDPASGEKVENTRLWQALEQAGEEAGVWDYFLDNALCGHYNTIKEKTNFTIF